MSNGMRKGLGYKDRPEHVKTEATIAFELELDRTLEGSETMGMLGEQIKELRLMGDGQVAKGEFAVATLLREAADTIESMRDGLHERECERVRDDVSALDIPHNGWFVCSKCGEPLPIMNRYCGGCGAIVRKEGA